MRAQTVGGYEEGVRFITVWIGLRGVLGEQFLLRVVAATVVVVQGGGGACAGAGAGGVGCVDGHGWGEG